MRNGIKTPWAYGGGQKRNPPVAAIPEPLIPLRDTDTAEAMVHSAISAYFSGFSDSNPCTFAQPAAVC
jgi:hypothetical protein